MPAVDDIIKQWIDRAERSGALQNNPHVGKPLNLNDGFESTPDELRMTHRILKNAGYLPVEVQMMQRIASLRDALRAAEGEDEKGALRREIAALQTRLAVMLERHRRTRGHA
jgi:hypothetical protein